MKSSRPALSIGYKPLLERPMDTIWTAWFVIHLAVMFCVDMVGIYPPWLPPKALISLRKWYIATYNDRFFLEPPAWFNLFIWMEALYHVPLSVWAIGALKKEHPLLPLHLLIWSVQTFVTTAVCVVDIISWPGISSQELRGLCGLYVPYCALALVMGFDMYARLKQTLSQHSTLKKD